VQKARKREMSKQAMRDETERLVKEAMERKTLAVTQGKTRIECKCGKCGALPATSVMIDTDSLNLTSAFAELQPT